MFTSDASLIPQLSSHSRQFSFPFHFIGNRKCPYYFGVDYQDESKDILNLIFKEVLSDSDSEESIEEP